MIPINRTDFFYPNDFKQISDPIYKSTTNYTARINSQLISSMNTDTIMSELSIIDDMISKDPSQIQDNKVFDLLVGLIKGFQENLTFKSMRVLEEMVKLVGQWINFIIKKSKTLSSQSDLQQFRTSTKMLLFLGFYLIRVTIKQRKQVQTTNDKLNEMMKKKKKKDIVNTNLSSSASKYQWSLIFTIIKSLNQLNLDQIWQQKQIQESFFLYYHNMAMGLILNSMAKDQTLRKSICQLFNRILLLKSAILKIIKRNILEQVIESDTKCQIICEYFLKCPPSDSLSRQVIIQILSLIKSNTNNNQQNQQMKNLSVFINKLCQKVPQVFLDYFEYFKSLYDSECYFLRNSMTTIIYSIIKNVFKQPTYDNKKYKQSMVSLLLERVYDKHIHARSHTLNTLITMIQENILPSDIIQQVHKSGIDRMNDIGVNPRKRASALVYECTKAFIFLYKTEDSQKLMKISQVQKEISTNQINISSLQSLLTQNPPNALQEDSQKQDQIISQLKQKIKQLQQVLKRYNSYLQFLKSTQSALPTLKCLLNSTNNSDVMQAIKLTVLFKKSDIENVQQVLQHVWRLVFQDDVPVVNQVINCFRQLYFDEQQFDSDNLVLVFLNSDSKKVLCFEKIIELIMCRNQNNFGGFNNHVVDKIWVRFKQLIQIQNLNVKLVAERQAIMNLLLAIFANNYGFIKSDYIMFGNSYIEEHIRNKELKSDHQILIFFFKIVKYCHKNLDWKVKQHFIFQAMPLVWDNQSYPIHIWCKVLETFIAVGFVVCPHPQKFLKTILIKLIQKAEQQRVQYKKTTKNEERMINYNLRLYFFLGQMIGKLTQMSSDLCDLTKQAISKGTSQVRRKGAEMLGRTNDQREKNILLDQINSDVHSVEYEGNYIIKQIQAKSLKLIQSNCIKQWVAQTVNSIKKIIKSGSDGSAVQKINVLNFGKLMISSLSFARQHVRELIALMTRCQDESIKINSIVIFSDAIAQNSSALSPYVQGLLQCILDNSRRVQITALNAIWYLIMSDILLFESHVSYMAIVFETQSDQIKDYCKRFLLHKNKKQQNFLLRKLPETVNELSEEMRVYGDKKITHKTFQAYAKQILPQIDKVRDQKTIESVISNLLDLIKRSLTPLVVRNACLALSLLYHNQKSLLQIAQSYKYISIKLKQDICVGYFRELVARMRRNAKVDSKGDLKDLIDEIEAKFVDHSSQNIYVRKSKQVKTNENKSLSGNKKVQKPKKQPKKKSRRVIQQVSNSEDDAISVSQDSQNVTDKRKQRQSKKAQNKEQIQLQSEEQVIQVRSSSRRMTRNNRARNIEQ